MRKITFTGECCYCHHLYTATIELPDFDPNAIQMKAVKEVRIVCENKECNKAMMVSPLGSHPDLGL